MALRDAKQKLDNIAAVTGKNDKRSLLKGYMSTDEVFAEVIRLMLAEDLTFNINELPEPEMVDEKASATQIFKRLEALSKKKGATDADKQALANLCGSGDTRSVVLRILTKKSDAGFSLRSVSAVAPWLLFQTPYQRCSGIKKAERVSFPARTEIKADGMFQYACSAFVLENIFPHMFVTRRGKSFALGLGFKDLIDNLSRVHPWDNPVFMGEFVVLEEDGTVMPRKKGNGLINKIIKGTGTAEIANRIRYVVWDALPLKDFMAKSCPLPFSQRHDALEDMFAKAESDANCKAAVMRNLLDGNNRVQLIHGKEVENFKEAEVFYEEARKAGEEGAILKDYNSKWKNNTAPDMVKMKNFVQAEFEIIAAVEGKGKYEGKLGALTVQSKGGEIVSNVGSGFSDAQRSDLQEWEDCVGKIITVQFESVIQAKRATVKSLFLPTFIETRFNEKTEADTTEYVEGLC